MKTLFLLFLLLPGAATGASVSLSAQRILQTGLVEARLVVELAGYAIVAGRSCADCDENISIYLYPILRLDARDKPDIDRYTYPGHYSDYLSRLPVEHTRMFYGRCYENEPALLWLSEYRRADGWVKSEYLIVFGEEGLQHRYNEGRQPSTPYLDNPQCVELPGIAAETEP
ncbi:hypothetical protein [Microbulbifer sp. 2201CG32-9]|uniref:hypothetical protein n=1 Tax=unclassified Microbulbifer TaxID=2619833 RepID=UPI00345BC372